MSTNTIQGNLYVNGNMACKTFTPPAGSVGDSAIPSGANLDADKLQHRWRPELTQLHGTAATAERRIVHTVKGATATIKSMLTTLSVIASGDRTVTIDLYKNGSSILTAPYVINSSNAAYSEESPLGFTSTSLVQGDKLEIVQALGGSTGNYPQGVSTVLDVDEDAA